MTDLRTGPTGTPGVGLGEAQRVELTVGPVAHGGHCVARHQGQVVFVRHALPGERVIAEITEAHRDWLRADAVTVLSASADRVSPPCPYARPGRCGGCDLQHVSPEAQWRWKAEVIREQLRRLGGLTPAEIDDLGVRVAPLPGGPLGWRTRVRYAVDAADQAGLLQHRSYEVVPIDRCLIAHPAIQAQPLLARDGRRWPQAETVEAIAGATGEVCVRAGGAAGVRIVSGPERIRKRAAGREWSLPPEAFWQVHPAGADTLVTAVRELLAPRRGESAWDLYGGAGLFAAALAEDLGPAGRVTLVESGPAAVTAARENLRDLRQVMVVPARVETALARRRITGPVDLVVLDPPRSGAGARVTREIAACGARAVAYVACDPATLARDVRTFRTAGWRLAALRAFDLFPMTQHVEVVALLLPPR